MIHRVNGDLLPKLNTTKFGAIFNFNMFLGILHGNYYQKSLKQISGSESFTRCAKPEWLSGLQHRACCVQHRWLWVWAPNLHQCLWTCLHVCGSKKIACHADLYIVSRCHTRGESQESSACRWQSTQARDPPWLWNPGETLPEVKNRGISGPMKRTYVLQNFF